MRIHFSICYWLGDWQEVPRLYREIRALFPEASIAFVPDGITPLRLVVVPSSRRLKAIDGGAWLQRIFESCPSDCDLFFKVEPDISLKRMPSHWPEADWFGHLSKPVGAVRPLLRGGFWGLTREAVQRLLQSWFLQDEMYFAGRFKYDRYGRFLLPGEEPAPQVYHCDSIMAAVMDRVGILPTHWDEIYLTFREEVPQDDRFAIVTKSSG